MSCHNVHDYTYLFYLEKYNRLKNCSVGNLHHNSYGYLCVNYMKILYISFAAEQQLFYKLINEIPLTLKRLQPHI